MTVYNIAGVIILIAVFGVIAGLMVYEIGWKMAFMAMSEGIMIFASIVTGMALLTMK